jgi:hypothetical protein
MNVLKYHVLCLYMTVQAKGQEANNLPLELHNSILGIQRAYHGSMTS